MTALLILKQKIKEFYGEHDTWILPILKFILAFGLFKGINTTLGFMGKLDNIFVVLILALLCSVMPVNTMTILGCVLSALSAVLGLAPYLCVWLVTRSVLSTWPSLDGAGDLGRFGWMAVWFAIGSILLYFAALMSTHIAAFRTARNIRRAAMTHVQIGRAHV